MDDIDHDLTDTGPLSQPGEMDIQQRAEHQLTTALTATQEAISEVRDVGSYAEATTALATADAHLVEASNALQAAIGENRTPVTPEQARIRELEAKVALLEANDAPASPAHGLPSDNVPRGRHDIRKTHSGRPRGMETFENGHAPPAPDDVDFTTSIPAPPTGYEPGQGQGRLAQAPVTGQGESASEALVRAHAIAQEDQAEIATIRERHGLPPEPESAPPSD